MFKINKLLLKSLDTIVLKPFTVIVGPNNAGKSQLLRDITLCASGKKDSAKIIDNIDFDFGMSAIEFLKQKIDNLKTNSVGQYFLDSAGITLSEAMSMQYQPEHTTHFLQSDDVATQHLISTFGREFLAYLTTEARLTFSKHQTNLHHPNAPGAASLVEALYESSVSEEDWISVLTRQAFGLEIALDAFSSPGSLEIRVAASFQGLNRTDRAVARQFLANCGRLDEQGDGLRSFVATLGAARTVRRDVILVDEPEAFLHPPQAFQMGRALVRSDFGDKQFICATHSADFLRGVLSASSDVTVIRVSQTRRGQTVNSLSSTELKKIADNPVLSSGRVLDGIFYRQVVITESDGDAVFYNALTAERDQSGETYYVNSYSKQATTTVAEPYRHIGVPYAAIVDIDLIRVGLEFSKVAKAFLDEPKQADDLAARVRAALDAKSADGLVEEAYRRLAALPAEAEKLQLPDADKTLEWLRARLAEIRANASSWSALKRSGIEASDLAPEIIADLKQLIEICANHGLFIVPHGERESWLSPDVSYSKNKTAWTTAALEYLASGRLAEDAPIRKFIEMVHNYLEER